MLLMSVALQSLMRFPSRYQRALDRCVPDDWLTVGLESPPDSAEELERKKQAKAEAKRKLEEAQRQATLQAEEDKARAEKEKKEKEALAKSEKKQEAFTFESLNPLAALQRQMDEITQMITDAQAVLDKAAGILERLVSVLDWDEPRITACIVATLLVFAWACVYVDLVVTFASKFIFGVIFKTFFTIISPTTIKWVLSFGMLFTLRHPAILPDAATAAIEEEKRVRRAAVEAQSEAADAGAKVDTKIAATTAASAASAFDPRPLAPMNIFFRIPTQSTRVL